jgi:hypothetical protein
VDFVVAHGQILIWKSQYSKLLRVVEGGCVKRTHQDRREGVSTLDSATVNVQFCTGVGVSTLEVESRRYGIPEGDVGAHLLRYELSIEKALDPELCTTFGLVVFAEIDHNDEGLAVGCFDVGLAGRGGGHGMLVEAPGDVGEWSEVNLNALVAHHSRWSEERWVFWCVWVGALQKYEKRRIECVGRRGEGS